MVKWGAARPSASRRRAIHRVAGRQPPSVRLPEANKDTQPLLLGQRREAVGSQRAVEVPLERPAPEDGRLEGAACSAHDDGHGHLHEPPRVRQPVDGDAELAVAREAKGGDRRRGRELRLHRAGVVTKLLSSTKVSRSTARSLHISYILT